MALSSAASPIGMILSGVVVGFVSTTSFFLVCTVLGLLIMSLSWFFTDIRHVETANSVNNVVNAS
jgi:hypothetical protein